MGMAAIPETTGSCPAITPLTLARDVIRMWFRRGDRRHPTAIGREAISEEAAAPPSVLAVSSIPFFVEA